MTKELTIQIASREYRLFLQNGFFNPKDENFTATLHKHPYSEIHLFSGGNAEFSCNGTTHRLKDAVCIVPPNTYHAMISRDENVTHIPFLADIEVKEFHCVPLREDFASLITHEHGHCVNTDNYTLLLTYLSVLLAFFLPKNTVRPTEITDPSIQIETFFNLRYSEDLHLQDLATHLHLSERQAERLVIIHTGKTFRDALADTRLTLAKELYENGRMSLYDIAEYIGYRSYTGFWKAAKRRGFVFRKHK
ncbi:MAG: helix-turn-helix domain-containing protein [Clostridia bacterium]|nr:helix-turn-helix domain-containing protein [Clostridia bacterium]